KRSKVLVKRNPRREDWLPEVDSEKLTHTEAEWIKAGALEKGDFLLVPKLQVEEHETLSDEQVELLGYYLAEGSTYYNAANGQYTNALSFGTAEMDLVGHARQLVTGLTGRTTYLTVIPEKHEAAVSFYSRESSDWFTHHCGKGATSKSLS